MVKAVAFYPEYFPDEIEMNYQKIKEGGIEAIRFGEFAWGHIEPEEGRFNFEVFDRAFALAEQYGLKIILGTPTACPPVWLAEKYPSILPVNDSGRPLGFGGRQHRCYNAPAFREAAHRIVSELSRRYGKHPALLAWQIDNELAAEHKYCYCDTCRAKFQSFLQEKYQTIDALNERWFTTFWAQNFTDFSQIPLPARLDAYLPIRPHPSLLFEFLCFSSDSVIAFSNAQAAAIRAYSEKPVTTNQDDFYYGDNVDWFKLYRELDFVSYDIYTEKLYEIGFFDELARCVKNKPFWQMEFSARSPILPEALSLHVEKGGEGFGLFTFNPFPAGQEQGLFGLVDIFGNPEPNYAVFRDWHEKSADVQRKNKKVRLVYDFESSWIYNAMEYHVWELGFDQIFSRLVYKDCLIHKVYKALFENGFAADVINSLDGIGGEAGDILFIPLHIIYREPLAADLLAFMAQGGRIVATADLFTKNADNAYLRRLPDFFTQLGYTNAYPQPGDRAYYGQGSIFFADVKTDALVWDGIVKAL